MQFISPADRPVIISQPSTYTTIEGSSMSIPCTFTGAPIHNVTWEHDNIVMEWSSQSQPLILSFQNVSRSAAGNYTCNVTVTFKGTYSASNTVELIVQCKLNEGTGHVFLQTVSNIFVLEIQHVD
jgi:hypothetical protein